MNASPERSPGLPGRSGGDNPDVVVRFQDAYSFRNTPQLCCGRRLFFSIGSRAAPREAKLKPSSFYIYMPTVAIGSHIVGDNHPTFVVGEIGINHNGDLAVAKKLIDAAAAAGFQAIKFQKRTVPVVYVAEELGRSREVPAHIIALALKRRVLPQENIGRLVQSNLLETTNGDLKWALELTHDEYAEIDRYCREKGMIWFASPWDIQSVEFLERFSPPAYKIASASLTDDTLLEKIRATGKPVILSTGMSTLDQIDHALSILGQKNLILMHCVSTYPSEFHELNLKTIPMLIHKYPEAVVGYSGHERGVQISVHAVALGAAAIERHITLDRTLWGTDQAASIEPKGMTVMVKAIRNLESALGSGEKRVLDSEVPIMKKLRRVG